MCTPIGIELSIAHGYEAPDCSRIVRNAAIGHRSTGSFFGVVHHFAADEDAVGQVNSTGALGQGRPAAKEARRTRSRPHVAGLRLPSCITIGDRG
jgi:hypothetical protein